MSQEKVDRYKKDKANRKKNGKKDKVQNVIRRCLYGVIGLVILGWVGYSGYNSYTSNKSAEEVQIDYTAINNYMQSMTSE